jgi:hypothetical protein
MRTLIALLIMIMVSSSAHADLLGVRNAQLTMLRVHDVGTRFGPPADQIDVEVVIQVANQGGSFGFQLRNDANQQARQGMLNILRDAMNNKSVLVNFDYNVQPPKKNGVIIRVWLTKPTQ